jgi:aminopeptidase YwaD
MDALGFSRARTAISFYNLTEDKSSMLRSLLKGLYRIYEGEPWFQGDHMAMAMYGVPAIAITSENFMEIEQNYAHTAADTPDLVDLNMLVETAQVVCKMINLLTQE